MQMFSPVIGVVKKKTWGIFMENNSELHTATKRLNLSPKEAAELVGCSEYTIKELARQKRIPSHKVGGLIKFTREGLEAWIQAQEKKSWIRV